MGRTPGLILFDLAVRIAMSSKDTHNSGSIPHGGPASAETRGQFPDASAPGLTADHKDFTRLLTEEVEAICKSEAFQKSPILIKLLEFLADETLAGHGDRLKSYSVAVDGLGRSADFDAHSDSYPRVQVARLRKMLVAYYVRYSPRHGLCIHIPSGSYGLHLDPRDVAYPGLSEGPRDAFRYSSAIGRVLGHRNAGEGTGLRGRGLARVAGLALLALAVIAAAALYLHFAGGKSAEPAETRVAYSPVLLVKPVVSGGNPQALPIVQEVYGQLLNGLSRSWVARIQTAFDEQTAPDNVMVYRLETQLGDLQQDRRSLYLRLFDHRTSTLTWAQEYSLRGDGSDMNDAMGMVAGKIGGSFGVIASSETRRLGDLATPGYACELQYLRYIGTRRAELGPRVRACLEQVAPESRLEGMRLASHAMLILDSPPTGANREALVSKGMEQAELVVEAYPESDYAQLALARFAFARGDCETGSRHTRLAMGANPNDPYIVARLVALTYFCGRPEPALADRAYRYLLDGEFSSRLATILTAIATEQRERLKALMNIPAPEASGNEAYNHLCNTLLFAALDRRAEAVENWKKYKEALGGGKRSDDELLSEFLVSDMTRLHTQEFLRAKHVIR